MTSKTDHIISRGAAIYLILGLWLVHSLHAARFILAGRGEINAFPNWVLSPTSSLFLGFVLPLFSTAGVLLIRKYGTLRSSYWIAISLELISQIIGRSLFKFSGDMGIWLTVWVSYGLRKYYSMDVIGALAPRTLNIFHAEALGVLRTLVNICLFVIGTLGISVTSSVIALYFDTDLGQGTAWVQVGSMFYVAFGMAFFIIIPLFHTVVLIRNRINETP